MVGPAQIRAARALLGMNQRELSKLAEVAISTVKRIETSGEVTGSARTLWNIQSALERAGVEFIPEDESKGSGVRLGRPEQAVNPRIDQSTGDNLAPQIPAKFLLAGCHLEQDAAHFYKSNPIFRRTGVYALLSPTRRIETCFLERP